MAKAGWSYDRTAGRWRRDGRFASKPDMSVLREWGQVDRLGRPLDNRGKRVPLASVEGAPPPPTYAPTELTYNAKLNRWQSPAGTFAPKPKSFQLPRNLDDKPVDSRGVRVPLKALADHVPKAPTPPPPKDAEAVRVVSDRDIVFEGFYNSGGLNKASPAGAGAAYDAWIAAAAAKNNVAADDLWMKNAGIAVHSSFKETLTAQQREQLAEVAKSAGVNVVIQQSGVGSTAYVLLGKESTGEGMRANFDKAGSQLADLWDMLDGWWGDLYWDVFAESDEDWYA